MVEATRKFLDQDSLNLGKWDLGTVVLEVFEFFGPFLWDKIRTGGEDLAKFDIGGA